MAIYSNEQLGLIWVLTCGLAVIRGGLWLGRALALLIAVEKEPCEKRDAVKHQSFALSFPGQGGGIVTKPLLM